MKLARVVVSLIVWMLASSANAQTLTPPRLLSISDSNVADRAPIIHIRNGVQYLSWVRSVKNSANGDIWFTRSTDGGQTFAGRSQVTTTGNINSNFQRAGQFVIDPQGTIHLIWLGEVNRLPDVFYARSTDQGVTWTAPQSLTLDSGKHAQDFPSIACDSSGVVYVAWIDARDRKNLGDKFDQLYFTRSMNGGASWNIPSRVNRNPNNIGGTCECCKTDMEVSPDGDIYIAFRTNLDNIRDIFIARSFDRGNTWGEIIRAQTDTWMIMQCPATGPNIALDGAKNLHVVWRDSHDGKSSIYYTQLPHGFDSCYKNYRLTEAGAIGNYADIAVSPNGYIAVTYQRREGTKDHAVYKTSCEGGISWTPETRMNLYDSDQEFAMCTFDKNAFYALWHDTQRDAADLMMASASSFGDVIPPGPAWLDILAPAQLGVPYRMRWGLSWEGAPVWFEVIIRNSQTSDTIKTMQRSGEIVLKLAEPHQVTVIAHTSLGAADPQTGTIQLAAGVHSGEPATRSIYPMPAVSGGSIQLEGFQHSGEWVLFDATGKMIETLNGEANHENGTRLSLPALSAGVYYISSGNTVERAAIVVK